MEKRLMLFGKLAERYKYVTAAQVDECLALLQARKRAGDDVPLGRVFLERGYMTEQQVENVLLSQQFGRVREEDVKFGQLAVSNGMASREQVASALTEQQERLRTDRRIVRLGSILLKHGVLSSQEADLADSLAQFKYSVLSVRQFSEELERDPSALFLGPRPGPAAGRAFEFRRRDR